ncbi:MAG: pilus (MSHA type) biogenesis protein MshL [Wenzhouxiangella sp.]
MIHPPKRLLVCFLMAALTGACATTTDRAAEIDERILGELEAASQAPPPAAHTRDLVLPPEPAIEPPPEERFNITVENAPADQFLMSLVANTELNMVVHPDVNQRISLELRNVTIDEVLEILQEIHGLEFQPTRTGFLAMPARLTHRVYEISYLDLNREGSSRTRVSSGQSTENPAALQDGIGTGIGSGQSLPAAGTGNDDRTSGTRIETTSQSNFWGSIEDAVFGVLDSREGRSVMVNPLSGVVAVRAMPHEHRAVAELLRAIEGSVQRQVILEAKIVEVELRDGFRSGINWNVIQQISNSRYGFGQVAGTGIFEEGNSAIRGNPLNLRPGQGFDGFDSTAFGGAGIIAADGADFNAFIELLETQGVTRVLSSPRVATINNQKAVIKVGTDEFFVTGVTGRTATGGASTTAASSVQLTPFFSGIALDVTPQIGATGDIILHIHPTVSEVSDQVKSFTVAGQEETLPLAFSSVRQSDSIIRARDGQLVVIGGLMRESSSQQRFGTPVLSRIPLVGNAFSSRQEQTVKTELVIMLRPTVVDDHARWQEDGAATLERFRSLSNDGWPR